MVSRGFQAILFGVLLWATLSFSQRLVDRVVASVNSDPILESDLKMAMLYYATDRKQEVLDRLIDSMLLYQYMSSRGMQTPQELIDSAIDEVLKSNNTTLEGLIRELARENLTLQDFRRFLDREILATQVVFAVVARDIKVSEVELQLQRLKSGKVEFVRDIELLVADRKDWSKLEKYFDPKKNLQEIAKDMGLALEKLSIKRGDLVEVLDKAVWSADVGGLALADDKDHVYIAKVLSQREVYEGRSVEELREEIIAKKAEEKRKELLDRLRKNSFIKIVN
ncbi:MAG: peptidylprolyl isomerase [Acidobacteria bacterium]|jgi:parvulin-like peptidyl-prolyl isomerase|nr:MAG: peptidylprolyl isomerase [Acidobacteriota bacterium]